VWWDDDVWIFIESLNPCRIEFLTDTCHAKGNWRRIGETIRVVKPVWIQLELPLEDTRRGEWAGQLVQWAGCEEDESSFGFEVSGGNLTRTFVERWHAGITRTEMANELQLWMPPYQRPAFSHYNASPEFLEGEALQ
jgi:hypothetical protein